jgi:hypothetical protein
MKIFLLLTLVFFSPLSAEDAPQPTEPPDKKAEVLKERIKAETKVQDKIKSNLKNAQRIGRDLTGLRTTLNEKFSRIMRLGYYAVDNPRARPSKIQANKLRSFLDQVSQFRNKNGTLSIKTTRRLINANPEFITLKKGNAQQSKLILDVVQSWDRTKRAEKRLLLQVNKIRTDIGSKPLEPYAPQVVRSIVRGDPAWYKTLVSRKARTELQSLLKSGDFKSRAEIRAAVRAGDGRVAELIRLEQRIQHYDRAIKNQPINQVKSKVQAAKTATREWLVSQNWFANSKSYVDQLPGNKGLLDAYRMERVTIYKHLSTESGRYEGWRGVRAAMDNPRIQEPEIIRLRQIDKRISKIRYELNLRKLPPIGEGKFASRWQESNIKLKSLKRVHASLAKNPQSNPEVLKAVKAYQRKAYLEQAEMRMKHQLLVTEKYPDIRSINKAVRSGNVDDPRIKSLEKIYKAQAKLKPQLTRSAGAKVSAATRHYEKTAPKSTTKALAAKASEALKNGGKTLTQGVKKGWTYTEGVTNKGMKWVKAKSADGWQYTRLKTEKGWKYTRMKTSDGWSWAKSRSNDAKGWAKGTADKGWKYVGKKADGFRSLINSKTGGFTAQAVEQARSTYNAGLKGTSSLKTAITAKIQAGWEYSKGVSRSGTEYIKARSADGWEYTKVKTKTGWKMAKIHTADGWKWFQSQANSSKGWGKGAADSGWKFVGNKTSDLRQLMAKKAQSAKTWGAEQARATKSAVIKKTRVIKETILGQSRSGWEVTHSKTRQGLETVKAKSVQGWEYTKNKVGSAWEVAKIKTADGWSWAKSRSLEPMGWARGKADPGWVYEGNKVGRGSKSAKATADVEYLKGKTKSVFGKHPGSRSKTGPANASSSTRGKGFFESELIKNTLKPVKTVGERISRGVGDLRGKGIQDILGRVKRVGNRVTDKVLGGKADAETGRSGYEVKRDQISSALKAKIEVLNGDIAKLEASGKSPKKLSQLKSLKDSLRVEHNKSQVGPEGIKLQAEIKDIGRQIDSLKKAGAEPKQIKKLQGLKGKRTAQLNKIKGDPATVSRSYVRDGLHFAVIAAGVQGILNIVDQVRGGDDVNVGDALDFVTTPQFVLGTSGAFAGGLLVQKGMATGFGKIALSTVQNMLPGFMRPVAQIFPFMMGAIVGGDLLTGNLGERGIGEMVASGMGSSVGMMLGSAIFPPIGSIVGAVLGGMLADELMAGSNSENEIEAEMRLLYEPRWLEFSDMAWTNEDEKMMAAALSSPQQGAFLQYAAPVLDGLNTADEHEAARVQAYEAYTKAVETEGPESNKAQNAYQLYEEITERLQKLRNQ